MDILKRLLFTKECMKKYSKGQITKEELEINGIKLTKPF